LATDTHYAQELAAQLAELAEPFHAAEAADLRYVCDDAPGIHRQRRGRG